MSLNGSPIDKQTRLSILSDALDLLNQEIHYSVDRDIETTLSPYTDRKLKEISERVRIKLLSTIAQKYNLTRKDVALLITTPQCSSRKK